MSKNIRDSFVPFDVAKNLDSPEMIAEYLGVISEEGDTAELMEAINDVARSKGMAEIAKIAGVGKESLYKSLNKAGNPQHATIVKILAALGCKFTVVSDITKETKKSKKAKKSAKAKNKRAEKIPA